MTLVLIVGGLVMLVFPGWLDQRRHGFGPARLARVERAAMTLGFVGVVLGLGLWGTPAVLHWADAMGLPGLCDEVIHRLPLGGVELAIGTTAIAAAISGRALAATRHAHRNAQRARVGPYFGRHRQLGYFDVVVIPSAQILAVGVPGENPQIVLSEGLVAELTSIQLDAVIRHEVAHHRLRHRQYLLTAAVVDHVFGWVPPVRASAVSLRSAVEQWADLESTGSSSVRAATLRSALECLASKRTTTAGRRSIERRIASLDGDGETASAGWARSIGLWVPCAALGLTGVGGLVFTLQITNAVTRC